MEMEDKYIIEIKRKLSLSEIKNIFGTTDIGILECNDMTDKEFNRIVDEFNNIGCTSFNYLSLTEEEIKAIIKQENK